MLQKINIYTGILKYKDIDYSFVFDRKELILIPNGEDKEEIINKFKFKQIYQGVYINEISKMEDSFLIGKCNENNKTIIFITQQGTNINSCNFVLYVKLEGYIVCDNEKNKINKICFKSPEINCIHATNQAYQYNIENESFYNKGVFSLTTNDFDSTSTKKQAFLVDEKNVQVQFSISKIISNNSNESPLTFDSIMNFEFEDTNDFCFIMKLCNIAKQFIQFLCYRRNIVLQEVALYTLNEDKKYHKFASIYLLNEIDNPEIDTLNRKQYISQKYIEGFEGKILEDIANNSLYLEHLPETYKSGRTINASRFIMITAAFE